MLDLRHDRLNERAPHLQPVPGTLGNDVAKVLVIHRHNTALEETFWQVHLEHSHVTLALVPN